MIGIVLIGHKCIASEMLKALEHVVGEQSLIEAVDVFSNSDPEQIAETLRHKLSRCDVGDGVLLLADMFGGTPCNIAMGMLDQGRVEVVSGFNLPLLVKAVTMRGKCDDLSQLTESVIEAGRNYIKVARHPVRKVG